MMFSKSYIKALIDGQTIFFAAIISCFIYLFFRNSGLYPLVVDEYFYNKFSRLAPFSEAYYPNYLFYAIYRATNICGDGFLACAQFLNCGFYVLTFIPIYRVSLTVCTSKVSFFISLLSILAPFNYFTAFFMTEAVYFLSFWVLVCFILCIRKSKNQWAWKWLWVGCLLGCASLIKINGLLLLPAIAIYLLYEVLLVSKSTIKHVAINFLMLMGGVLLVKFGISLMLVGRNGLTFGGIYAGAWTHVTNAIISTSVTTATTASTYSIWNGIEHRVLFICELIKIFLVNLIPIGFIFGIPISNILTYFKQVSMRDAVGSPRFNLYLLSTLLILNLLLSTAAFSWVAIHFGGEKLHAMRRYYEFAYPFFFIITGSAILNSFPIRANYRYIVALIVCVFIGLAISRLGGDIYWHSDWFSLNRKLLYLWTSLLSLSLILWTYRADIGNKFYLFMVMPLVVILMNWGIWQSLQTNRIKANETDRAGLFVRNYLSRDDVSKLTVVSAGHNLMGLFYFDNPNVEIQTLAPGNKYKLSQLPIGKDWILLLDNLGLDNDAVNTTHMDYISLGYATLFGGHGLIDVDLSNRDWQGAVKFRMGLSNEPEQWGIWSSGNKILLEFSKPLPRKFNLLIDARAFGPNVGKDFVVRIDNEHQIFRLGHDFEKKVIPLFNPKKTSEILIEIPLPISPRELGAGNDDRKLGIGIKKIQIQW